MQCIGLYKTTIYAIYIYDIYDNIYSIYVVIFKQCHYKSYREAIEHLRTTILNFNKYLGENYNRSEGIP